MRKRHISAGWPRRDPRHYRFPIPNAVWEHQLKPIYENEHQHQEPQHRGKTVLTPELIAKGIHKSADTVKKYLSALVNAGLVTKQCALAANGFSANDKNFFTLPVEIFLLKLPPSAFMVYAYLLLIEDRRTHTCHPSYNTIADKTGMTRNTVIKSVGVLLDKHLIAVERTSYLDDRGLKWNGNNLYTILSTQCAVGAFYQQQLHQLELTAKFRCSRQRSCGPEDSAEGRF